MKLKEQVMDFEVFKNWFCNVVGQIPTLPPMPKEVKTTKQKIKWALEVCPESIKDTFQVFSSDDPNVRAEMLAPLINPEYATIGYNMKGYDAVILNGVANHLTPRQLRMLSDCITELLPSPKELVEQNAQELVDQYKGGSYAPTLAEYMSLLPMARTRYRNFIYCDLFDDNSGSLKEKESLLGLDIMESAVDFEKEDLTEEDKVDIIKYCKHDVWAAMIYYIVSCTSFVGAKLDVADAFGLDVKAAYTATNGTLVARALKAVKQKFPDEMRESIDIPKGLKQYIEYALPKDVIDKVCNLPVYTVKGAKHIVQLFGNEVVYANGGIHSIPRNNVWAHTCEEWGLWDFDASSFYPFLMSYHGTLTRTITDPASFRHDILERRLYLKDKKDATPDEQRMQKALKGILVTLFGISGSKFNDCYDLYKCSQTCRVGQLVITALANNVFNQIGKSNIQIVQCNTDGVMVFMRRDKLEMLKDICKTFTEITSIPIEFTEWKATWQRNVNNYLSVSMDGKIKSKGEWLTTEIQTQTHKLRTDSGDNQVAKNACQEYLINGKDIVEYIYSCQDITEFVVNANKGNGYKIVREFNDGREDEYLYRCNRVLACMDKRNGGIKILRRRLGEVKKYRSPSTPDNCELINHNLHGESIDKYKDKIDYMWYIMQAVSYLQDAGKDIWFEMQADKIIQSPIYKE